uniref:uncharacterized protein LOC131106922 isoform X2 n=1 Tax=Doryrhamphus excisus TaxID=161450 RepID=UPI0025AE2E82|nr:uncharacterized protein LOC131106922 isoform X2 [Doryrhamphus excisus]
MGANWRTCNMPGKKPPTAGTIFSTFIFGLIFIAVVPGPTNGAEENIPQILADQPATDTVNTNQATEARLLDNVASQLKSLEARVQAQEVLMLDKLHKLERDMEEAKLKALEARIVDKLDKDATEAKHQALKGRVDQLYEVAGKRKVAFSASRGDIKKDDKLVFGNVYANTGGAYDSSTGVFTAPCKGVYFFTLTYHKKDGNIDVGMYRKMGTQESKWIMGVINYVYNNHHSGTSSRIVELEQGESVFVKPYGDHDMETTPNLFGYTVFSGFLIDPM